MPRTKLGHTSAPAWCVHADRSDLFLYLRGVEVAASWEFRRGEPLNHDHFRTTVGTVPDA